MCNQEEDVGVECNQKDGGGSENSSLNENFGDSYDDDDKGIGEETAIYSQDGKTKGKGKGKGKAKGKRKGKGKVKGKRKEKGKAKGKGKGKSKIWRPRKQREVEESFEDSGSIDDVNEGGVPKESLRGLSDIEEYDSDELPQEYDREDEDILKDDIQTFILPK
ncbi:uncharacterized protein LOC131621816 [Vicia villosa]|uniref:uncharacterized protein LOC131621816 n=1 Tax=Vicia villosa TaxID=3911 RepID=UPI00273A7528|nr:uncharacterized protein LOC131621816 [Vicia villosa]